MSIIVKDVSFSYGEGTVLNQVSFQVEEGQLLVVLGPNGVGKSTLFRCMLGLLNNYSGQISISGEDIRQMGSRKLAKLIAYVPQYHYPSFNFSVSDMVLMGTSALVGGLSTPGKEQIAQVDAALKKLNIYNLRDRGYTHISGGERQLALIARALVQNAKTLIMDEPTANLDYGNQLKIMTQIKQLTHEGYSIVLSTHNPDHAFWFSDQILALSAGQVLAKGAPRQVMDSGLIQKLYGAKVNIESLNNDSIRICVPCLSDPC
ncbi:MAG: ABC transporter ATP-binding protein [Clostridiales bacterium]